MFYEVDEAGSDRAAGAWNTFSIRNLALGVNRTMAREFGGNSNRLREASVKQIAAALRANPSRWTEAERRALENWSLVLAQIPQLVRWTLQEKLDAAAVIRAQAGRDEMKYLRLTQQHARLRDALLRLGSKP